MAAWRTEEVDAFMTSPGEERGNATGKTALAQGGRSLEICEVTPIGLVDESKEFCTGVRPRPV